MVECFTARNHAARSFEMVRSAKEREESELDQRGISKEESKIREIIATSGISVRLWRLYAYFWFICLVFPLLSLIQTPPSGFHLLITIAGLIMFVAVYFWVMWPHPLMNQARTRLRLQSALTLIIGLTFLVLLLSII